MNAIAMITRCHVHQIAGHEILPDTVGRQADEIYIDDRPYTMRVLPQEEGIGHPEAYRNIDTENYAWHD